MRISPYVYAGLTVSLLLNTALIPVAIIGNSTVNGTSTSMNYTSMNYTSIPIPVNSTCTRNQTQIRAYIGRDYWVHKCDNGIYDIRQFLGGKPQFKGINLFTTQWNKLQSLTF